MQAKDTKLTISGSTKIPEYQSEPKRRAFWIGRSIIVVAAIAAVLWVVWGLKAKEVEFEASLQKRLELMAATQVQLTEAMLETAISEANRVINAEGSNYGEVSYLLNLFLQVNKSS